MAAVGRRVEPGTAPARAAPVRGSSARQGLSVTAWPPLRIMAKDVRVSVALTGRHSLEAGDVERACEGVKRALQDGAAEFSIQSFVPGHTFIRHGSRGGSGMVAVKIDLSSFAVVWDDVSSFDAPAAELDAIGRCLGASGETLMRITALVSGVAMDPPRIANGSLDATFSTTTFRLGQPAVPEGADGGKVAFEGVATVAGDSTVNLTIIGEQKSPVPGVRGMLVRALGTLSAHCGALTR